MFRRSLSTTCCLASRFDPKLFVDPIITLNEVSFIIIYIFLKSASFKVFDQLENSYSKRAKNKNLRIHHLF